MEASVDESTRRDEDLSLKAGRHRGDGIANENQEESRERQHIEKSEEIPANAEQQSINRQWVSIEFGKHLDTLPDVVTKEFFEFGIYIGQLDKLKGLHGSGAFRYDSGDVYEGEWDNNQRHGVGNCVFYDTTRFEGEWCEDKIEGEGVLYYSDGSLYEGSFHNNLKHGVGRKVYASGSVYKGEWNMGRKSGTGTLESFDGNVYTGGWVDDNKNGYGSYWRANREWQYAGFWKDGKRQGHGLLEYSSGATYDGDFKSDMFHGKGTMQYADGSQYSGEWENNLRHGEGTLVEANSEKYTGYWVRGLRQGLGMQVYANVDRYEGAWMHDEFNGYGTFTYFQRQQRYQGEFRDGYRHGRGKMIYGASDVYEGSWTFDLVEGEGSRRYPDGSTYTGTFKDGKRHGHGVLQRTTVVAAKQGDGLWVYEGEFEDDLKHGKGLETFKTSQVWVTYMRDRLAECDLKQAETGLKQRKAWAKDGLDESIPRGQVRLDPASWKVLELKFVDDVAALHNIAIGTPMLRALLKNPALRTPGTAGELQTRKGSVHLDALQMDHHPRRRAPYLEAVPSSVDLLGDERVAHTDGPQGSPRVETAGMSPLHATAPPPHHGSFHAASSPRGVVASTPRGSGRLDAASADVLHSSSALTQSPQRGLENAAVKLQAQISAGHGDDVGLVPLHRKPGGTLALRRKSADRHAQARRLQPLPGINVDWGPPGPKIHLGKDEGPL